jgi:hypothetical protein
MKKSIRHAWRASILAAASLWMACDAFAQATVSVTPLGNVDVAWGLVPAPQVRVQLTVPTPCPTAVANSVTLRDNGVPFTSVNVPLTCGAGQQSGFIDVPYDSLRSFGSHQISAHYPGGSAADQAFGFTFVSLREDFRFTLYGNSVLSALASTPSDCTTQSAFLQVRENLEVEPPPPNLRMPYEHISFSSTPCTQPPAPLRHSQLARMEFALPVPANSQVWVNDYLTLGDTRSWRMATATFDTRGATFEIFGRTAGGRADPFVFATAAVAIPQSPSRGLDLQGLWWSGEAESGWGLNIAKNDERIFASLFIYDSDGKPQWVVMPGGQWDPLHEVYWGDLYIPSGSFHGSYDSRAFKMGEVVGTGSLSFPSADAGRFDYVVRGLAGGKNIERFVFGTRSLDVPSPHAGMFWGGPGQDGWGVSIQEQGASLFATWYTYGPDGKPIWFYMSGGRWTTPTTYSGDLFRSTGAAWLGNQSYSSSNTHPVKVGTLTLAFQGNDAATMTSTVDGLTQSRPISRFGF